MQITIVCESFTHFTVNTASNPNKIIDTVKNELQATNIEYKFLDRENNFKEISLR